MKILLEYWMTNLFKLLKLKLSFPFSYFIVFPGIFWIYLDNISFPYPYDPLYFSGIQNTK